MKAALVLEDGRSFYGQAQIAGEHCGEAIFNTAVVGYQEMCTDPANAGKILVLTYPLIGNYGCAPKFDESKAAWLSALVIKEKSRIYSNWQAKESFDDFAKRNNLLVISDVDTRTLAVHLRKVGQLRGIVSTTCLEPKELVQKIKNDARKKHDSMLAKISVAKLTPVVKTGSHKVAVLDLGITRSILRQLERLRLAVTVLPYNTPAKEILRVKPDGLIISGGPEEDSGLKGVISEVAGLVGVLPILGISCGHQVLAAALGAKVVKMKLGHHGVNYPIYTPGSYKAEITVQNHSWTVDADSLSKLKSVTVTRYNLNDRTVEEMESKKSKLIGAQYVPACPGFDEINPLFKRFVKLLS